MRNDKSEPEMPAEDSGIPANAHDTVVLGPNGVAPAGDKASPFPEQPSQETTTRNETQNTVNLTAGGNVSRRISLTRQKYISLTESKRNLRAAQEAAEKDAYELKDMMARGAEAILYRGTSGAFTYCVKCIRNGWSKFLGGAGSGSGGEKLENVKYSTKLRHIRNECDVARRLTQESAMPIVRMFALRRVTRFGIEIGYDLLMEHLAGHDLSDKVLTRVLPMEDKIRVLHQAAQALDFVHRRKIVHLDIKPSNFMLVNGQVKLIDFGVSVSRGHHATSVTGTGGYLSPEQICRDVIDESTDLFAFGVAFGVFFGGRPLSQPQDTLMSKQGRQEARFQLDNMEQPLLQDIPALGDYPDIANLLRRCTIPRRDRRVATCALLMHELQDCALKYGISL